MSVGRFISTQAIVIELPLSIVHLPERGGDVPAGVSGTVVAGGYNVVSAVVRQGVETCLASPLGTGPNSAQARALLAQEGIRMLVSEVVGDNGLRITLLEQDGTRTTVTSPGVEIEPNENDLSEIPLQDDDWIYVSANDLAYPSAADVICRWVESIPAEIPVAFGASPMIEEVPLELLKRMLARADFVSMNHRETKIAVSELGPGPIAEVLRRYLKPTAILVHRHGEHGCTIQTRSEATPVGIGAYQAARIDTTGVGDTHIGVMIAGIMQGLELEEAARRANAAGAITLTRPGAGQCPRPEEIDKFLANCR